MVDASGEVDFGRLEGVVGREVDGEEEDAARVRRVALNVDVSHMLCFSALFPAGKVAGSRKTGPGPTNKAFARGNRLTGPIIVACQWNYTNPVSKCLHIPSWALGIRDLVLG